MLSALCASRTMSRRPLGRQRGAFGRARRRNMWGPVAGGRLPCVRCAAVAVMVLWVWFVGFWPFLVCRPGQCAGGWVVGVVGCG